MTNVMEESVRRLLLVRHAESEGPDPANSDRIRQLTAKGRKDAHALGVFMHENGILPDIVLCSPAIRTRQTFHGILESVQVNLREYPEELYDASAGQILDWIKGVEERHRTIMVIGHNPGIHMLVRSLAGVSMLKAPERFFSYPPGTFSLFNCHSDKWDTFDTEECEQTLFLTPENYNNSASSSQSAAAS
jgi:phosphohistidine phosphatase